MPSLARCSHHLARTWDRSGQTGSQGDSAWRDFVNRTIADLLVGITDYNGRWVDLYDRWFGPRGNLYYPLDRETAQRLASSAFWLH
jgi:polar amino acid transport system substrate-binding protein